ncbi:MAG: hypothetical protein AAB536_03130 [Patescibacteria group bacterium]
MSIADAFGVVALVLLTGAQLFSNSFLKKYVKFYFLFGAIIMFSLAAHSTFLQYKLWKASALSVFLLPPYRDWSYFISYTGPRFFYPLLIAFFAAVVLKYVSEFLNRRFGERFFKPEESWFLAFGVFFTGYPGLFLYIPLILVAGILLSFFYFLLKKGRAPLFYLWLPVAIFAILLKNQIPSSILNGFIL